MPAQKVRTEYDSLGDIARTFVAEAGKTRQTLNRLHRDLDVLLDGAWKGRGSADFYREMISSVLPSVKRLGDALEQAGRLTQQISRVMKQAEEDAARLFSTGVNGRGAAGGSGGEAARGSADGEAARGHPAESGKEGERQKTAAEPVVLEQETATPGPPIDREQLLAGLTAQIDGNYRYTVADLHLELLSTEDLLALQAHLGTGQLPLDAAVQQIGFLQDYWGYDNSTMISALREIYYPEILDNFIAHAGAVDSSIYEVAGDRNGIAESQAVLARALLMLSTQGEGYRTPILTIDFPPGYSQTGEFGLDHVISGLDGHIHFTDQIQQAGVNVAAQFVGIDTINSRYENTWRGDLGATVEQAILYTHSRAVAVAEVPSVPMLPPSGDPSMSVPITIPQIIFTYPDPQIAAQAGYQTEMPFQDLNGGLFANAIIRSGILDTGIPLAQVFREAFDPQGDIASDRYQDFAQEVSLVFDPQTGQIDPASRAQFIENNIGMVARLGLGLYNRSNSALDLNGNNWIWDLANRNLTQFLGEVEAGLRQEVLDSDG